MAQSLASLIRRLFWILLALFLIFFSVNNRQTIDLSFVPFDFTVPVPAFLLIFIGIFIGLMLAAGVTGWLRLQGFARRRKAERRAAYLEDQVSALAEDAHRARAGDAHSVAVSAAAGDKEFLPKGAKGE